MEDEASSDDEEAQVSVLKVLFASPMCNDFSKLRLLPDRKDYRGHKRRPGEDPRAGLDGKYGRTFRTVIKIIQWVLKYHPHALYFVENVEFKAMGAHWKEVCDALGEPLIVNHEDHSTTKRRRAYWSNFEIPDDWHEGRGPIDPDTCMDPGRKVERYPVKPIYRLARWIVPMILLGTDVHARAIERVYNALAVSLATLNSK